MPHDLDRLRAYLNGIGLADVQHTHDDLLSHVNGTYRILSRWNVPEHVVIAGLFHSVYGTEGFPRESIPLSRRDDVRRIIGSEAERLVYRYSAMSYGSLEKSVNDGRPLLEDRFIGEQMPMTQPEFEEVLWMKLADAFEQADDRTARSRFFREVAELLGLDGVERWKEQFGGAKDTTV